MNGLLIWAAFASLVAAPLPQTPTSAPTPQEREEKPVAPEPRVRAAYTSEISFRQSATARDQRGSALGWVAQDFRLAVPFYRDKTSSLEATGKLNRWDFDGDTYLPAKGRFTPWTRREFPDHLWDMEAGIAYRRTLENDWGLELGMTVGSASDRPFSHENTWMVDANGSLRIPINSSSAWRLFVNVANMREFAPWVPMPGFGYEFKDAGRLSGLIGFPYNRLEYKPVDWLIWRGEYVFPRKVDTEFAVPLSGWELFAGYAWTNQRWLLADREDDEDRLFYYEQRIKTGLRTPKFLEGTTRFELETGYAFDRTWFEGQSYTDRSRWGLDVGDGMYARFQFAISF